MKLKNVWIVVLVMLLAACGNPVEQVQEAVSEQVAEQVVEAVTDAENVDLDTSDGSVSFSVGDGEGGEIAVSAQEEGELDALTGMGFTIPLPDGLQNVVVQRVDENGAEVMVNATYELGSLSAAQFIEEMHQIMVAQGFTYMDMMGSDKTEPGTTDPMIVYIHPDGYQFSIIGDDSGGMFGLTKTGVDVDANSGGEVAASSDEAADGMAAAAAPVVVSGAVASENGLIALDKDVYQVNEDIWALVTLGETAVANDAWVGVIPSETPHGQEVDSDAVDIDYEYITRANENSVVQLNAPDRPGSYDIRLFDTDAGGVELASITITVTE